MDLDVRPHIIEVEQCGSITCYIQVRNYQSSEKVLDKMIIHISMLSGGFRDKKGWSCFSHHP